MKDELRMDELSATMDDMSVVIMMNLSTATTDVQRL